MGIKDEQEYKEFPLIERRNLTLEYIEVPAVVKSLRIPKGKDMLEVGCGPGVSLPAFYRLCQPSQLVGIDIDETLVKLARERINLHNMKSEIIHGDVRQMPFDNESFDIVLDFGTCYHINKADLALLEISRVLRPGGIFVFETKLSQLFSHPFRSYGKQIPWGSSPDLKPESSFLLWGKARKLI